jgi:hypothetical protein
MDKNRPKNTLQPQKEAPCEVYEKNCFQNGYKPVLESAD